MATISEDYVSFETAKLLKEKGFKGLCTAYYDCFTTKNFHDGGEPTDYNSIDPKIRDIIAAPTLQMAMKWLRKVHNCPIEILWHWDANSQCSEWYFVHHMELKPLPQIQYYDTYEEAAEAAIKYCLEHLI